MSRSGNSAVPVALLATLLAAPAHGGARLEVSGEVVATAPRLEVRVVLSNRGDVAAGPVTVVGELEGERREARVVAGVAPGGEAAVILDFTTASMRAGLHALTLLLEHPLEGAADAAGNPPVESQRAFLLLALGSRPAPAVRLEPATASLDVRANLPVSVESADGESHRVRLRVLTARGLRAPGPPVETTVPASGPVWVAIPVVRSGAPRGSRHGVLVVAETVDEPLARAAVAEATVDVAPDPSLLPRLRWHLLGLALALFAVAALAELRRRRA